MTKETALAPFNLAHPVYTFCLLSGAVQAENFRGRDPFVLIITGVRYASWHPPFIKGFNQGI